MTMKTNHITPPEQPKEYIITEEMVQCIEAWTQRFPVVSKDIAEVIRSRPLATAPMLNSTDLLLLANDEWKRRQERKHLHDNVAWVSGFVGGFLTDKRWAADYVAKLHKQSTEAHHD